MKSVVMAVLGLGAGGLCYAGLDGPDFDRTVARPPQAVYAAFAALGPSGTTAINGADGLQRKLSTRVTKTPGDAIRYEVLLDDRPVVTADLGFAPADGGRGTRITAELEIDAFELGSAYQTEAGVALSLVPEGFIDARFAAFMDDMVDDVEAGRPLPPLRAESAGVQRRDSPNIAVRRSDARREQHEASRPMMRPRPMLDPDRVAREHLRGTD